MIYLIYIIMPQNIMENLFRFSWIELNKLIEKIKDDNRNKGKFCLGCIKWNGKTTYTLVKLLRKNIETKYRLEQDNSVKGKWL